MKETKINISAFQLSEVFVYQGKVLLTNKPRCNSITLTSCEASLLQTY